MNKENMIRQGEKEKSVNRWRVLALSLCMLLSSLSTSIANVALPTLVREFNAPFPAVQWIVLAYLLTITISIVSLGRLGDLMGRRRLLLYGIILFIVASTLCSVAPSLWFLIVARIGQGFGAAILMAQTMAIMVEMVAKEKTGGAMGLLGTTSAIGTALGPSLGGMLITQLGWQAIFLINLPIGLCALVLAYCYLPNTPQKTGKVSFDHKGTLLLALTLGAYALAMTRGQGHFTVVNLVLLLISIIGAVCFIGIERKVASPLIQPALFHQLPLTTNIVMSMLVSAVMMTTLIVGPFYLSGTFGFNAALTGVIMSVGPLIAAIAGVPAGYMIDRLGARRMMIVGLFGITISTLMLALLPESLGILTYILPIMMLTAFYALFQAANNTVVMTSISPDQRGVISGMLNLSRNLGLITGASVMATLFIFSSGAVDITTASPDAIASGMHFTFAVASILLAITLMTVMIIFCFVPLNSKKNCK